MSPEAPMDHKDIAETLLAERYVLGQLSPEEAAGFEEHFLDCDECLERLELARGLRQSLLAAAAEDAARVAAVRQLGLIAGLARLARSRRAALFATAVLVLAPGGLLLHRVSSLDDELARTRETLRAARPPALPAPPAPVGAGTAGELQAARSALAEERAKSGRLAQELAQAERPEANTPLLALAEERSGGEEGEPARRLTLPRGARRVVLTLDLAAPDFTVYRATLLTGRRRLWQGAGLVPGDSGGLVLTVPASLLPPGDYAVEVEGENGGAGWTPVAHYRFRVR